MRAMRYSVDHLEKALPWFALGLFLLLGWRVTDLSGSVAAYGDTLEMLWGISWFGDHILAARSPLFYPLVFHPEGWYTAASSNSPTLFVALLPLYSAGGAAFAFNIGTLASFLLAFSGTYCLARTFSESVVAATLAALLYTFWGFRWLRIGGHLNQLLASSFLPWLVLSLENGLRAPKSRRRLWPLAVGVIWGTSIACSLYFAWIGGTVILVWMIGRSVGRRALWGPALRCAFCSAVVALLMSSPALFLFFKASRLAGGSTTLLGWNDLWGASLNSIPRPFTGHPWLRPVADLLYRGPNDESAAVSLGLVASAVGIVGFWRMRRERLWRPILWLTIVGLVLAMGYTLRWDGKTVTWDALRPLDEIIWKAGHLLKPGLFVSDKPFAPFDRGIPLPGLVLTAAIPFWEGARTLSRFAFIAMPGFFLLVAHQAMATSGKTGRLLLLVLLLLEIVPRPSSVRSAIIPSHPAFDWVLQNSEPGEAIVDLGVPRSPTSAELLIGGSTLWATRYHQRPTASGAGSVWPAHTWFLRDWLLQHEHPLLDLDFVPLMRYYGVKYVLLHMDGSYAESILAEARDNSELVQSGCFEPPKEPSPWPYSICVITVRAPKMPQLNVVLEAGWSGAESWGVWAEGVESKARWVATAAVETRLLIDAFPQCIADRQQNLTLEVNGLLVGTHQWQSCEPWSAELLVPASSVRIGWNEIVLHYGYAARPIDSTKGSNADARALSVGFSRLQVVHQ